MNEVEKMYENAEPDRNCNLYKHFTECPMKHTQCEDCENFVYPPFTAEKQIALLKLLIRHPKTEIYCRYANDKYKLIMYTEDCCTHDIDSFENALASVVCDMWGLLTEEECKQIKEILE